MTSALFTPFELRGLALPNRIVVSPMCQYSSAGRQRQRLAPDAPRPVRDGRGGAADHRGYARLCGRTHQPPLPGAVQRRQRVRAAARGGFLPPLWRGQARHPACACGAQGLGAYAGGGQQAPGARRAALDDAGAFRAAVRAGLAHSGSVDARRSARSEAAVRRCGEALRAHRLRSRRAARRTRLPAARVPVAHLQSSRRRVRRQHGEPHALSARGVRSGARGVAGGPAAGRARLRHRLAGGRMDAGGNRAASRAS